MTYIEFENEQVIRMLIEICFREYPDGVFEVRDTEGFVCKTRKADSILNEIDGGDEEIGLNFYDGHGKFLGWFGILPYEEDPDCIIFDMSDNKFCEKVMEQM